MGKWQTAQGGLRDPAWLAGLAYLLTHLLFSILLTHMRTPRYFSSSTYDLPGKIPSESLGGDVAPTKLLMLLIHYHLRPPDPALPVGSNK